MRLFKTMLPVFIFVLYAGILGGHVSAETFNKVVAIVNEEVITLHELEKKIKEMTGMTPDSFRSTDNNAFLEARRQILDLLIDEKITQSKIKELRIEVTPKQIDAAIERIKKTNKLTHADLIAGLKKEGITYEKYRQKIKEDIERINLINTEVKSKIILREEQLVQYYEKHKKDFTTEERVRLAGIFLTVKNPNSDKERRELSRKGEEILRDLKDGKDFGQLAKTHSRGPGADEKGDLGFFKSAQLEAGLRKILEDMPVGGVSDLIETDEGARIIKLTERQEGRIKPFEEVRGAIYSILYGDEVDKRFSSWIKELRKSSYTKILF